MFCGQISDLLTGPKHNESNLLIFPARNAFGYPQFLAFRMIHMVRQRRVLLPHQSWVAKVRYACRSVAHGCRWLLCHQERSILHLNELACGFELSVHEKWVVLVALPGLGDRDVEDVFERRLWDIAFGWHCEM